LKAEEDEEDWVKLNQRCHCFLSVELFAVWEADDEEDWAKLHQRCHCFYALSCLQSGKLVIEYARQMPRLARVDTSGASLTHTMRLVLGLGKCVLPAILTMHGQLV
jgi:hypothetical protein